MENSSVGVLFVGKKTPHDTYGVLDIDGALRGSDRQLAYQVARSITNNEGDVAGSAGPTAFGEIWVNALRLRAVGKDFDISQVGFVPWQGTMDLTVRPRRAEHSIPGQLGIRDLGSAREEQGSGKAVHVVRGRSQFLV